MEKEGVVGWIGFLVIVLILLGVAGVVLGVSFLIYGGDQQPLALTAGAIFFLQATLAFGFALRSMTR